MIYPKKLSSKKSDMILKICMLASVLIAILLVVINRLTTSGIPWAALSNAGILYIWITVMYAINKNINIAGHVLLQTIAISILVVYIDYNLKFRGWSVNIAIPILIIIANITMFVLTIVSHKKYIKYAIYQLLIVIFSILPVVFIHENLIHDKTLSIVAVAVSVMNLIVTLALCAKDVKEAVIRKFHL